MIISFFGVGDPVETAGGVGTVGDLGDKCIEGDEILLLTSDNGLS